jgi:TetR/AcrR family fatty acid metabolism transcriptional regulator
MSYMRSEARQRQILSCAKRVFAQRGFHAANVSHICQAAGIGRGTLYQYFTSKHAVLTAILREALERVRALMEFQSKQYVSWLRPEELTRTQVMRFTARQLRHILGVVFDDDDSIRILLREAVGLDVEVEKLLGEIDQTLIAIVERDLRRASDHGVTRELDARMVATMVVGAIEKLALAALRSDAPVDLDALAEEATKLHAIGTLSDRLMPH